MIVVDVKIKGQKEVQLLKFMDGQQPRIGETVVLGTVRYTIVDLGHKFHREDGLLGSFHNECYYNDIPGLEITLKKKG